MSPQMLFAALFTFLALMATFAYRELILIPRSFLDYVADTAQVDPDHVRILHGDSVTPIYGDSQRHRRNIADGRPLAIVQEPAAAGYHLSLAFFGREPRLFVHDGGIAKRLLDSRDTGLDPYRKARFSVMYPRSLIANDGAVWERFFKLFEPMFKFLDNYHAVIENVVEDQIQRQFAPSPVQLQERCASLLDQDADVDVDLVALFKVLAARVIGACAFGDRMDEPGAAERVANANTRMFTLTALYMNTITAQLPWLRWLPTLLRRRAMDAAGICRAISGEMIDARISGAKQRIVQHEDFAARAIKFMQDGTGTRAEVLDNSSLLVVAGHETTAYTLAWMGYLMARNESIFRSCQTEVREVMGADTVVEPAHLANMHYLKATVTETLRLFPPVAFIERKCKNEFALSDKCRTRPGISLTVDVFGVHHDPNVWADPYTADPRRHLDAQGRYQAPAETAFLPFSAGARRCPGERFARRELQLVWAYLMRNFDIDWKVDGDVPMRLGITIAPDAPIPATLRPAKTGNVRAPPPC